MSSDGSLNKQSCSPRCIAAVSRTLSSIPTTFGRLCHVADLRSNPPTRAVKSTCPCEWLCAIHRSAFQEWISLRLHQQQRDLMRHFAGGQKRCAWDYFVNLPPQDSLPCEKELFISDLKMVVESFADDLPGSAIALVS